MINLSQPWHLDCRIEAELPEDRLVGTRFLANTLFVSVAGILLLVFLWLAYSDFSLRGYIRDWEIRMDSRQAEVNEIQQMQSEYFQESAKIDEAYALMQTPLSISEFMTALGRTRPEKVVIDIVKSGEPGTIIMLGSVLESSGPASRLLGQYVKTLLGDAQIGPYFREILVTDMKEGMPGENALKFEVTFRPR